ncbi:MAG: hypothetical protein ACRD2G_12955, partial [Terriglobia bacterium]
LQAGDDECDNGWEPNPACEGASGQFQPCSELAIQEAACYGGWSPAPPGWSVWNPGGNSSGGDGSTTTTSGPTAPPTNRPPISSLTASGNVDLNIQFGPYYLSFAAFLAIDSHGCIAYATSGGPGRATGSGQSVSVGASASASSAQTVQDLAGPFVNLNGSVVPEGAGVGGQGNIFSGNSPDGPVVGGTLGVITGEGASAGVSVTTTKVTPITHLPGGHCGRH